MGTQSGISLEDFGWNERWAQAFLPFAAEGLIPGRVTEQRGLYRIVTEHGEAWASTTGKLRFHAGGQGELPAVGDWVAVQWDEAHKSAVIRGILPRSSKFSRKVAGEKYDEQVVAANIDQLWLLTALDADFNLRRLERYLTLTWESGASPVIVLTKADLCPSVDQAVAEVMAVAPGVPVHVVSNLTGAGIEELRPFLEKRLTIALLGSSGVGKSTLINRFAGEELQRTNEVREHDSKGKHTTTHRQMIRMGPGALIIDSPGMRELQLWESDEGLADTFPDIGEFAARCKFTDCRHMTEPGCAVRAAIAAGNLDEKRLESYQKLHTELERLERRSDPRLQSETRRKERTFSKLVRRTVKEKGRK